MESPQSVVSPFKTSSVYPEPETQNLDLSTKNLTKKLEPGFESGLGVLEVHIHQARDIQNICIYHKQDVYAKICITSNPEQSLTTQTVNGGGQNPIFNETLKINVPAIDSSSLKVEVYMLSRVRNYLEDQLLGFCLIPLSEIVIKNGRFENEFCLSSTDLFHSPSGFVHLSLSYTGAAPDIITISQPHATNGAAKGATTESELAEFDKIEFPDPKIVTENHMMVTEYYGLSSESDDQTEPVTETIEPVETPKPESPPTSVSTNESQCANRESGEPDSDLVSKSPVKKAGVTVLTDFDQKVVQQDFVDLYMKSMQQFTESLAKMKLPLDVEKEGPDSGKSGSDPKVQTPDGSGRVFYGSRAFF